MWEVVPRSHASQHNPHPEPKCRTYWKYCVSVRLAFFSSCVCLVSVQLREEVLHSGDLSTTRAGIWVRSCRRLQRGREYLSINLSRALELAILLPYHSACRTSFVYGFYCSSAAGHGPLLWPWIVGTQFKCCLHIVFDHTVTLVHLDLLLQESWWANCFDSTAVTRGSPLHTQCAMALHSCMLCIAQSSLWIPSSKENSLA